MVKNSACASEKWLMRLETEEAAARLTFSCKKNNGEEQGKLDREKYPTPQRGNTYTYEFNQFQNRNCIVNMTKIDVREYLIKLFSVLLENFAMKLYLM